MKKKILHISNYYTPHIGGIESTCQYLAEGVMNEYEVKVICFSESKKNKVENINGIDVHKAGVLINIAKQSISLSYFNLLRKIIKEWQPDLIHFHHPNPFVMFLLLFLIPKNTKLYIHWHLDITNQKKIYPFIKVWEDKLLKRADKIVTTSPNYLSSSIPLQKYINKVEILPSAIDIAELQLENKDIIEIESIRKKAGERKIILYAGRHVEHKGVHLLLEACTYITNDCVVYIAGMGTMTEELKRKNTLTNVFFLGKLEKEELKQYYYAADILAFPSYTKSEAFGLVLLEAMYCQTATVTFSIDGSGVNWVALNDVTGIEVENGNVKAFAEAIDHLIEDDELRIKYAKNGKERVVSKFTIDKEIQTLLLQYDSLLKK